MTVSERDAPAQIAVKEGGGEEEMVLGNRGGAGGNIQVIQRLWAPPGDGELLPIPGTGDLAGRRQLVRDDQELVLG